jgi:hypothetical protein
MPQQWCGVVRHATQSGKEQGLGEVLQRRVYDVQLVSRQGGDSTGQPMQFGVDDGAAAAVHQGNEVRPGIVRVRGRLSGRAGWVSGHGVGFPCVSGRMAW